MSDELPTIWYSSDMDGDRHAIVDPAEQDMSGWSVIDIDEPGSPGSPSRTYPFELIRVSRLSDGSLSLNPYLPPDEICNGWAALADRTHLTLTDPRGRRYPIEGRPVSGL